LLFDVKGQNVTFKQTIEMDHEPLKACFDSKGNIWCTTTFDKEPLVLAFAGQGYVLATKESKEFSGLDINQSLMIKGIFMLSQDPTDPYEIGKLRKWSQWEPNFKMTTVAEKRKVIEESGQAKKSKRSGKKQKDKREQV
jgi:hypothetical protein